MGLNSSLNFFFTKQWQYAKKMQFTRIRRQTITLAALLLCCWSYSLAQNRLEIQAGDTDRASVFISFHSKSLQDGEYELIHPKTEAIIPLQRLDDTTFLFFLEENLPKGERRVYHIQSRTASGRANVTIQQSAEALTAFSRDKTVLRYNTATLLPKGAPKYYERSGFIHPLYSPAGQVLTDDFPQGHTHQHGIFHALVNTTFRGEKVDFWNQHDQTGTVRHQAVHAVGNGLWTGSFTTTLEHLALTTQEPTVVLEEEWTVQIYPSSDYLLFDITSVQTNVTTDTLYINDYHYGGMAFRGSAEWNAVDTARYTNPMQVLTSEGVADVSKANHNRPNWIAAHGSVAGNPAGIAIFSHPENYRHPQPVRVHPQMPYLCFAPMVEGGFAIAPGETYTSHYRFVTYDEQPEADLLERLWQDYATPPNVKLFNH